MKSLSLYVKWSNIDEAYVIRAHELGGCVTHGKSIPEALRMMAEAVELYLASTEATEILNTRLDNL